MKFATGVPRPCNMFSAASSQRDTTLRRPEKTNMVATTSLNMITKSWELSRTVDSGQSLSSNAARLRDKWMEFQGIKNWEGLLDPLDDDLRDEILRYGEFVEAAYRCFDFDITSSTYFTCMYPETSILTHCASVTNKKGYKVTRNLYATCGVQLPEWIERLPTWVSTQCSWIGYVAVCDDADEIARLGRRDVVVAYRGTATCLEWLENLRATLACLPDDMAPDSCESMVQTGFLSLYTSGGDEGLSLQHSIREEIGKILREYSGERLSITVTGHSLGAALATLTAYDINATFEQAPLVTVVSFGGPRVGNRSFRSQLEKSGTKVLRIVNSDDPITKVPGFVVDESGAKMSKSGGGACRGRGLPGWLQKHVEDTQWAYAEIGKELRLSSKGCPHLNNMGVATCHDLKTYLHLVDNFVSSNCPLRETVLNLRG